MTQRLQMIGHRTSTILIVASMALVAASTVLHAQGSEAMDGGSSIRYAITQGGLFGVLLVGGWMYRQDFIRIFNRQGETIQVLSTALQNASAAMSSATAAMSGIDRTMDRLVTSHDQLRVTMVEAISHREEVRHR